MADEPIAGGPTAGKPPAAKPPAGRPPAGRPPADEPLIDGSATNEHNPRDRRPGASPSPDLHPNPRSKSHHLSRRTLLIGSGAAAAAVIVGVPAASFAGVLPGRSTLFRVLGLDGPAGTVPDAEPGPMTEGTFRSTARLGVECGWGISYPPGSSRGDRLPVAVVLHGYSDTYRSAFGVTGQGFDHFLARYVNTGGRPFAIAAVDGGNTYWHRRRTGEDASRMVVNEFLPLLSQQGLTTDRIGILGWSMGGYGALRLAGVLGEQRVSAVAAASPALWRSYSQAAHGAFDDAADFAANTVYGRQHTLNGIRVRVDCGTGDGFCPNDRGYVAGFAHPPAGGFTPGGHNVDFWRRINPNQVRLMGSSFA